MAPAKPFLKWAGGKTSSLPEILPRLPEKIGTYYEPFLGGGAVFFALASEPKQRFKGAVLNDLNQDLMIAYRAVRNQLPSLLTKLSKHVYDEDYYYEMRALDPKSLSLVDRAARFIYLNRTCFNGLYRENRAGKFNVPFGKYTNPIICDASTLRAASAALSKATLNCLRHNEAVRPARPGDVVYFDPPYAPLSATSSFTAYTRYSFDEEAQTHLRDCARVLVKRGVFVILSNSDTPLVRHLYRDFKIETVEAQRRINSKGAKRGKITELLIVGKKKK